MPHRAQSIRESPPAEAASADGAELPLRAMQRVIDTLHEPFLLLDADGRLLAASTPFFQHFHLSADEALGRPLFELAGGAWDVPSLRALLEPSSRERDRVEGYELEVALPELGARTLSANLRPVAGEDGRLLGHLLALRDVTEQGQPGSAPGLRIVPDHGREMVWVCDRDGTVRYVSRLAEEMLGYGPEELTGCVPPFLLHADDVAEFRRFLREAWEGRSQGLAYRVRKKSGEYVWLGSTARAVREAGDAVTRVQVVSRDVTERKRTEEALRWLGRQTRLILDSAGEGIYGLDLDGRITFINPAGARILGYAEGELVGRPHHETLHHCREDGAPYPEGECPIHATLRDGVPRPVGEDVFCRSDGSVFPVEYNATPAREGEKIVGAVVTFRDITERREAEAGLRRAEWLAGIGQTVLTLRHEINNPLTSMLADAALLEMEGNTPEEEREMVRSIIRQARRIRDVVHRLAEMKGPPAVREVGSARMLDLSSPPDGGTSV